MENSNLKSEEIYISLPNYEAFNVKFQFNESDPKFNLYVVKKSSPIFYADSFDMLEVLKLHENIHLKSFLKDSVQNLINQIKKAVNSNDCIVNEDGKKFNLVINVKLLKTKTCQFQINVNPVHKFSNIENEKTFQVLQDRLAMLKNEYERVSTLVSQIRSGKTPEEYDVFKIRRCFQFSYEYSYKSRQLIYNNHLNTKDVEFQVEEKIQTCLSDVDMKLLVEWIGKDFDLVNLLIASNIMDGGFDAKVFHQLCDYVPNLLVIIFSDNYRFGAFTPVAFKSKGFYTCDESKGTFLFSLDKKTKFPLKPDKKDKALYDDKGNGPSFGDGYDLLIKDRCNMIHSSANLGKTFDISSLNCNYGDDKAKTFFTGSQTFKVRDLHIYKVNTK